jgi:hypothetical protein
MFISQICKPKLWLIPHFTKNVKYTTFHYHFCYSIHFQAQMPLNLPFIFQWFKINLYIVFIFFMLWSYIALSSTWFLVFKFFYRYVQIGWVEFSMMKNMHLTHLATKTNSCKIFWSLNCLYKLETLNWPPSWILIGCLAHTFHNHLSKPRSFCKTISWIF